MPERLATAQALRVVPLRHPWTWLASVAVVAIAAAMLFSVATNPAFEWPVVGEYMLNGQILLGLARTLELTVIAMAIGLVLGTVLAVMRLSANRLLSTLAWVYIWFFGNEVISMVKNTSLVSVIALAELLYTAQLIYARTYETIPLLIVASLWYLAVVSVLSAGQHVLERRYRAR